MGFECFNCGQGGHVARECPAAAGGRHRAETPTDDRPAWCGYCDRRTRLIDCGTSEMRCASCHPLAWRPLPQHERCGGCNKLRYAWDTTPCDHEHHAELAS